MWYPNKAAFRVGFVWASQPTRWDRENIGEYSFASGFNSAATGNISTAMGDGTLASGFVSIAMGGGSIASGDVSTAMGDGTVASGYTSTSIGFSTIAAGRSSAAFGELTVASGRTALALGTQTFAIGESSVSAGYQTKARPYASFVIGAWNDTVAAASTTDWVLTDPIFMVGNGNNNADRRNAMVVLKNGNTGIGTSAPSTTLHVKGNNGEALRLQSSDPFIGFYDNAGNYSGYLWANKLFGNDLRLGTPPASLMPIVLAPNGNVALLASSLGNVGIGTITPAERLEVVAGPSATATKLVIGNKGGFGPAALEFVSDHGLSSQWRPGYIASNDNGNFTGRLEFFTNGTGSNNSYGAVKGLEVRNGATLTATGSVGSFSDVRLKNNIEPFTDGLNVIEQISPVQFQYKPDAPFASTDKQVGIVAQELEKVAPYMVHQTAEGNVKDVRWVDNQAYVFLLINAVKELTEQNKELKQQVKAAQKQLDVQHQMLQALISKYK